MKRLTCEMCGSQDLIKKEGVFECQSCGCKYTVEEAKKLMVEGVVEVKVTEPVKIDNSSKIDGFYEIARRAREDDNITQAAQYYNLILQEEPNSWEAQFYSVYYTAMDCKIAGIPNASHNVAGCLNSVITLMLANTVSEEEQQFNLEQIGKDIIRISEIFLKSTQDFYVNTNDSIKNQYTLKFNDEAYAIESMINIFADEILKRFDNTIFGLSLANKALQKGFVICCAAKTELSRYVLFPNAVDKRKRDMASYTSRMGANKKQIDNIKESDKISSDKESFYSKYLKISNESDNVDELNECIRVFSNLGNYKNSKEILAFCNRKKSEIEREEAYKKAVSLLNEKNYDAAIRQFESLGDYKDSKASLDIAKEKGREQKEKADKSATFWLWWIAGCLIFTAIVGLILLFD